MQSQLNLYSAPHLLLATSIPPQLRSVAFDPLNTSNLQQNTIASWSQAGFSLVSFHSTSELEIKSDHEVNLQRAGVSVLRVDQQDSQPLPNLLSSLKNLVDAYPTALLAITNADIIFANHATLYCALQSLKPDQALIGRRINVTYDSQYSSFSESSRDSYGFDFFAFHAASLHRALPLIPEGLVFGRPWWDLFLPLALLASGLQLRDPGPNIFLHPYHEERWSSEQWYHFGYQADYRFLQLLREQKRDDFALHWRRLRRSAILRWPGVTGLRHRFKEQRRALSRDGHLLPLYLSAVSDAINALVEDRLQA